jgi:hypothetical protein
MLKNSLAILRTQTHFVKHIYKNHQGTETEKGKLRRLKHPARAGGALHDAGEHLADEV